VVESVFSQYCGHSSAAGVTRYLKFREPLIVDPVECARAKDSNGNITINRKVFNARIGSHTSHSFIIAGSLDRKHNCEVNTLVIGKQVIDYKSAQSVLEISLTEEFGRVNDMNGHIKLPGNIYAKTSDRVVQDSLMGTMVWSYLPSGTDTTVPWAYKDLLKRDIILRGWGSLAGGKRPGGGAGAAQQQSPLSSPQLRHSSMRRGCDH
jgi:hypothetical protein